MQISADNKVTLSVLIILLITITGIMYVIHNYKKAHTPKWPNGAIINIDSNGNSTQVGVMSDSEIRYHALHPFGEHTVSYIDRYRIERYGNRAFIIDTCRDSLSIWHVIPPYALLPDSELVKYLSHE
jgi:hypothetical protein